LVSANDQIAAAVRGKVADDRGFHVHPRLHGICLRLRFEHCHLPNAAAQARPPRPDASMSQTGNMVAGACSRLVRPRHVVMSHRSRGRTSCDRSSARARWGFPGGAAPTRRPPSPRCSTVSGWRLRAWGITR